MDDIATFQPAAILDLGLRCFTSGLLDFFHLDRTDKIESKHSLRVPVVTNVILPHACSEGGWMLFSHVRVMKDGGDGGQESRRRRRCRVIR
jgi:hypothetical protein